MKWFLVVMILNGGVSSIPMDTYESCIKAQDKILQMAAPAVRVACVAQD